MEQNQELYDLYNNIYEQLKIYNYANALEIIENSNFVNDPKVIYIHKLIKEIISKRFLYKNSDFKSENDDNIWKAFYQYANHQNYLKAKEYIIKINERYNPKNQINEMYLYNLLIERLCKKIKLNKVIYDIDSHILSIAKGNCNQFLKILKIKELLQSRIEANHVAGYNNYYDFYTLQLIVILEKLHNEKILQVDRIIYSKSISRIANFDKAFLCGDAETMCELMLANDKIYDEMLKQKLCIYPLILKKILLCYNHMKKTIDYEVEHKSKYSKLVKLVKTEEYNEAINFCVQNDIGLNTIEELSTVSMLKR